MSVSLDKPILSFIGAGRVGRTLAIAAERAGYRVAAVASRSSASAQALARSLTGCVACDEPQQAVDAAQIVFLTVPDDALERTAERLQWREDIAAVHCSGATEVAALDAARRSGARTGGFHPMQAFADVEQALAGLPGCSVAIESDSALARTLEQFAQRLGLHPLHLPPGARALYHLSGSYAASFITALLHEAGIVWTRFGWTPEQALAALLPMARSTLNDVERLGTLKALTGPISRGDAGTVERHFEALAERHPEGVALYAELASRSLDIAAARGGLGPERLRALLDEIEARRATPHADYLTQFPGAD